MDSYFKVYDCVRGEGTHDYDFCEWNDFSITDDSPSSRRIFGKRGSSVRST